MTEEELNNIFKDFDREFNKNPEENQKFVLEFLTEPLISGDGVVTSRYTKILENMQRIARDPSTPDDSEAKVRARELLQRVKADHPELFKGDERL